MEIYRNQLESHLADFGITNTEFSSLLDGNIPGRSYLRSKHIELYECERRMHSMFNYFGDVVADAMAIVYKHLDQVRRLHTYSANVELIHGVWLGQLCLLGESGNLRLFFPIGDDIPRLALAGNISGPNEELRWYAKLFEKQGESRDLHGDPEPICVSDMRAAHRVARNYVSLGEKVIYESM